jgi:hypothetical protein
MAWTITRLGDTRERFQELVRERFPKARVPRDIGLFAAKKLEDDIRMHPMLAAGLPQFRQDEVFRFGGVEVSYHIDSENGEAEIRSVRTEPENQTGDSGNEDISIVPTGLRGLGFSHFRRLPRILSGLKRRAIVAWSLRDRNGGGIGTLKVFTNGGHSAPG